MSALSDLLDRYIAASDKFRDLSNRKIAEAAGVSRGTVDKYRSGSTPAAPSEDVLQAFHDLLGIPLAELREAAGVPRGESEPYRAPTEFNRLSQSQRVALDEFVRSFVGPQGVRSDLETTPEPTAQAQAVRDEEVAPIDSGLWTSPNKGGPPLATQPSFPDVGRAVVPTARFTEYQAALKRVLSSMNAVTEAVVEKRLTTDTAHALFDAINSYVQKARVLARAMQDQSAIATRKQIDVALGVFEYAQTFAYRLSAYIEDLLPMAPNLHEAERVLAAQQSLRELSTFHRNSLGTWIETARSSKSLESNASRQRGQPDYDLAARTVTSEDKPSAPKKAEHVKSDTRDLLVRMARLDNALDVVDDFDELKRSYARVLDTPIGRREYQGAVVNLLREATQRLREYADNPELVRDQVSQTKALISEAEALAKRAAYADLESSIAEGLAADDLLNESSQLPLGGRGPSRDRAE